MTLRWHLMNDLPSCVLALMLASSNPRLSQIPSPCGLPVAGTPCAGAGVGIGASGGSEGDVPGAGGAGSLHIPPCPLVRSLFAGMTALQFVTAHGALIDKLVTLPLDAPITEAIRLLDEHGLSSVPITRAEVGTGAACTQRPPGLARRRRDAHSHAVAHRSTEPLSVMPCPS